MSSAAVVIGALRVSYSPMMVSFLVVSSGNSAQLGNFKQRYFPDTMPLPVQTQLFTIFSGMHCEDIHRFYGKITGNQLPVHFPLFFYRRS